MEFRFVITEEGLNDLEWEETEVLQGESRSAATNRRVLAKFMVNQEGQPVPFDEAMAILGRLKKKEREAVFVKFWAALAALAVPPESGGS